MGRILLFHKQVEEFKPCLLHPLEIDYAFFFSKEVKVHFSSYCDPFVCENTHLLPLFWIFLAFLSRWVVGWDATDEALIKLSWDEQVTNTEILGEKPKKKKKKTWEKKRRWNGRELLIH